MSTEKGNQESKDKTEPKKPRKKRTVLPTRFIVIPKSGPVNVVDNVKELAALYKANPECEAWTLGKKVRGILCIPGKHDLVKNIKEEDKVMIALEK